MSPVVAVQRLALMLPIREILSSNRCLQIGHADGFLLVLLSLTRKKLGQHAH